MSKTYKIVLLFVSLTFLVHYTFADRGISKKSKARVTLNIVTNNNFKKALSLNLKSGLKYSGSLITATPAKSSNYSTSLITYQKGNTTYIIPYRQKIIVSEIRQGYTGLKLIIKTP